MPANTSPVFPVLPVMPVGVVLSTANTAKDGTGTAPTLYTAGANGSKLSGVKICYTGTSVATVLRLFINNGGTTTPPSNNSLYASISIPANTLSETAAAADIDYPLSLTLPPGYRIMATLGTTIAAGVAVTVSGGDL